MSRHAYCIIAHTDLYTLNTLLRTLDDPRNDIYLMVDRNSELNRDEITSTVAARLTTIPRNKTLRVYWGDRSIVAAELALFELARSSGQYDYFHLLSGQDLPLKTQDEIHAFFSTQRPGTNFIGFSQGEENRASLDSRMSLYVPFTRYYRCSNPLQRRLLDKARSVAVSLQERLGIKPRRLPLDFKKGCQWATLSGDFVRYLIENKKEILHLYSGVTCCDEIYKQTAAWNSPFRETLYDTVDEYRGCLREIDWTRGRPYVFRRDDLDSLLESDRMFARKFDSNIDKAIIDDIATATIDKR